MNHNKFNTDALRLAQTYFHRWTNHDFESAAKCLSAEIKFDMPINVYATREAFMQAVAFTRSNASDINMLSALGNDNEAILLYEFNFGAIKKLRIAEHFIIENNSIIFIRHIHDTFEIRNMVVKDMKE